MHQAGEFGEDRRLAGEVVMEGVVDEMEGRLRAELFDDSGGFRFRTQRADLKAKRLDEADNPAASSIGFNAVKAVTRFCLRASGSLPLPSLTGTSTRAFARQSRA